MTMFGPWYDPREDPPASPWPGFDPERIVTRLRGLLVPFILAGLTALTFMVMRVATG